jgi:uncharacterized membrane protein (DUF4010 family)
MSPAAVEILLSIGVALAAGFLVGAERQQGGHTSFGGVRTFPLIALSGALGMLLGAVALAIIGVALAALLAIAYYRDSTRAEGLGLSTEVAAVVTFGLGVLCTSRDLGLALSDRLLLVAAGATITFAFLSVKQPLHRLMGKLTEQEVFATAKLLVLAVLVLPLLPARAMGPWDALNPRSIGILAILISAIGFAGYAAIRIFGAHHGLRLTGLLGGLVSSTAVTLSFAGRARAHASMTLACAVAIVLASASMFPRVVVEVAAVSPRLAAVAAWPFLVAGGVSFVGAGVLSWRLSRRRADAEAAPTRLDLGNPFSVWSTLKFTLLFVVILLASHGASHYFADAGVYFSAALAGLADVDAISLSIARMHEQGTIGPATAQTGLVIAATSNTLVKIGLAGVLGSRALAARVALGLLAGVVAGGAVLLLMQGR